MTKKIKRLLILDANILIDFCKSDKTIIKLITKDLGNIYLTSPVFEEIKELDENDCDELGIILVEPELEHVLRASEIKGPLSFQDHLNLILAKENGWTCVTNDKRLRVECAQEEVPLIWGIELICLLVEESCLPIEDARGIILKIHELNPKYITNAIVESAFERLKVC